MTTHKEALKHEINLVLTDPDTNLSHGAKRALDYVLGQLEALAQPAVSETHKQSTTCGEPVAFLTNRRQRLNVEFNATGLTLMPKSVDWKIPLYTTPPYVPTERQRTWEGLSVFEINDLVENTEYEDYRGLVEITEAKLKEKNT